MEAIKENQQLVQIQEVEERIIIKNKHLPKNFMISMPCTSVDYNILCDILSPEFLSKEIEEHGGKDYVGGICYGLDRHDKIIKEFLKRKAQTSLIDGKSVAFMMDYLNKTKLRLIEPESERLRLAKKDEHLFLHLKKIPEYLQDYIETRENQQDQDAAHYNFWKGLFKEDESKRMKIAHFISWTNEKEIEERKADLFIPSVPYIKRNLLEQYKNDLLHYTKEINRISYNLYNSNSVLYFVIDADLFIDSESIKQLNNMIIDAPNKYIFFKILHIENMPYGEWGYFAKKNFEDFLNTLLACKEVDNNKVIGMLNANGFGYCLLNIALNFFTDTISNFPAEGYGRNRHKHRSLLHPISLVPERIEGILQQLGQYHSLFLDDFVADKYRGMDKQKFEKEVNKSLWSIDARKMGLLMWQKLISARLSTDKNKVFDEVINSNFSFLGGIIRHLNY